jgi:putative ABC transport system permease protein
MWIETIRLSLRSMRSNKMRSFLTMLGIIIGVMAVIMSSAVGTGAKDMVTKQVESLGSNVLTVMPGSTSSKGVSRGFGSASTMTFDDVSAILDQDPDVALAAPLVSHNAQVVYGANNTSTAIEGTNSAYPQIKNITIAQGRFFIPEEVSSSANVAVLGSTAAQTLFSSGGGVLGQTIDINSIPFTVIGVAATQGSNGFQNLDDSIAIPVTTEMNLLTGSHNVNSISISANSADVMNQAQQEIEATLRAQHHLTGSAADDFTVQNQATILSALGSITTILTVLLGGISGISLLVGGIGIMNIMLVSVTERTREIGIRKAIGAKSSMVLKQFLTESLVLSLTGALVGVLLGGGSAALVGSGIMHLGNVISPSAVVLAVAFSILVGIVFGVYPARKAAKLKPIDALRFE